jgi:hypothetical protein
LKAEILLEGEIELLHIRIPQISIESLNIYSACTNSASATVNRVPKADEWLTIHNVVGVSNTHPKGTAIKIGEQCSTQFVVVDSVSTANHCAVVLEGTICKS